MLDALRKFLRRQEGWVGASAPGAIPFVIGAGATGAALAATGPSGTGIQDTASRFILDTANRYVTDTK